MIDRMVTARRQRRIGVVVPALELGGGVPSVAEFVCQTIEQSGAFDVELVSLVHGARDSLGVSLTKPGSWLRGVGTEKGVWRGRPFTRVGAFISELELRRHYPRRALSDLLRDCDLIQVVCGSAAAAWSVCHLGKPVAVHCATRAVVERQRRDTTAQGATGLWRRQMTKHVDQLERKTLRTVDAIQAMNIWMLDYATAINDGRKAVIRLAPPGVDAGRFRPATHRDLQSDPYVLCVGRLDDPRKNLPLLIDSYSRMPARVKATARLVLAGLTEPSPAFWTRVHEFGLGERVTFVHSPTAEELARLYQGASLFASTSDEEGFGMVLVEAMASGIPVVSTASGGPNSIVVDGDDGFLVDLEDAATLSDRLTRLLSDPEMNRRMGKAARETVMRRFESSVAGQVLLDVYEQLLPAAAERRSPHAAPAGHLTCVG